MTLCTQFEGAPYASNPYSKLILTRNGLIDACSSPYIMPYHCPKQPYKSSKPRPGRKIPTLVYKNPMQVAPQLCHLCLAGGAGEGEAI